MSGIIEFSKQLEQMPIAALCALIILGAFALSAFAISTVAKIARGRRAGN
jgi:hypothetical protein